jgi:hypothetical protein
MALKGKDRELCGGSPRHGRSFVVGWLVHLFLSFISIWFKWNYNENLKNQQIDIVRVMQLMHDLVGYTLN